MVLAFALTISEEFYSAFYRIFIEFNRKCSIGIYFRSLEFYSIFYKIHKRIP